MTCRVACCQVPLVIGDTAANLATLREAVERAAGDGAQVVVLPELASSGYVFADRAELEALAEPRDGETVTAWAELAAALGVVVVGGFPERAGDAVYNSAAVVDTSGVRGIYRKAHLWDAENSVFDRGDDLPLLVDTEHGRLGVMICYDVEFPEWVRAVALAGADLLCAPVNWPLLPRPDGERPTEQVRVLAGAGINRLPMAVCDRTGVERGQDWIGGAASSPTPTVIRWPWRSTARAASSSPTSTWRQRGSRSSTLTTTPSKTGASSCTGGRRCWISGLVGGECSHAVHGLR